MACAQCLSMCTELAAGRNWRCWDGMPAAVPMPAGGQGGVQPGVLVDAGERASASRLTVGQVELELSGRIDDDVCCTSALLLTVPHTGWRTERKRKRIASIERSGVSLRSGGESRDEQPDCACKVGSGAALAAHMRRSCEPLPDVGKSDFMPCTHTAGSLSAATETHGCCRSHKVAMRLTSFAASAQICSRRVGANGSAFRPCEASDVTGPSCSA
eukprot:scaffold329617_cov57-Tisochrysis_lutea.AAC.1